jgi:hypothetical protein
MPKQIQGSQTDFSFGEVDVDLKRNDTHPARKGGLRQMTNARILNAGGFQNRPGRRALFPTTDVRIEKFTISPGNNFKIGFAAGLLQIISDAGAVLQSFTLQGGGAALPWATATDIYSIRWAIFGLTITICFGNSMRPQVVSWDGVSVWSIADYTETVIVTGQKRTPFYRITPPNITALPSATTGAITVTFSSPIVTSAMNGTRIRYINSQILLGTMVSSTVINATVEETLIGSDSIAVGSTAGFQIGTEVIGKTSGAKGIVFGVGSSTLTVQPITGTSFAVGEELVGPAASSNITAITTGSPQAIAVWDDEVMNSFRGFPSSVFTDQFRLGFCGFPDVPRGVSWSAINAQNDLYTDASNVAPDNAMFELIPAQAKVQDVVPGAESSEFVFCDGVIYYIPISPTNPLKPGSVQFQLLSSDGAANVQPRKSQEVIVYANAGANSMMVIVAVGDYYRPFRTKSLTDFHQHLFSGITAIAIPTADGQFNERYAYVLNANGSLVVGKYNLGDIRGGAEIPKIGWGPWGGAGTTQWVSAWNGDVHFTSTYLGQGICERLDDTLYLDSAVFVNAMPAPFAPPGGKGPLWFWASQSVALMDQVNRAMGTYQIDANGFIIPQNNGGENLAAASLVAGLPWTMIAEPFPGDEPSGPDMHQRMLPRRISFFAAYVINSTGFYFAKLFSGKLTPTSPALGTVMNIRRVTTWNQGDNPTLPPPLRETVEEWRPSGYSYDPRVAIIKDTPGTLTIPELGMEISI